MRFIIIIGVLVLSCKKSPSAPEQKVVQEKIKVELFPVWGSDTLFLDSIYETVEGYKLKFTDVNFYLSELRNGTVLSDAALFNYRENGNLLLEKEADHNKFYSLKGNVGVGELNHSDPSSFPTNHPLNIMNANGMHWGWNPGYIFVQIEAVADTIVNGEDVFNHQLLYHVGKDENLQVFSFSNLNWDHLGSSIFRTKLKLDLKQFLNSSTQNIDIKTESTTHTGSGEEALSLKVIQNVNAALSVY